MEEEKITLTLESPAVEEEKEEVKEEEVKATVDAAKLDDSGLSAEEKKMVEDFSKQIDITVWCRRSEQGCGFLRERPEQG